MIDQRCIEKTGGRIDKSTIIAFENEYKTHFPTDYFEFLLEYGNEGVLLCNCIVKGIGDIITNIHGLEFIKGGLDWIKDLELDFNEEVISDKMIPIAKTETNRFYCIYKGSLDSNIYKIDFQTGGSSFMTPIAQSFTDLINKLIYKEI